MAAIPTPITTKVSLFKGTCNSYYIADSTRVLIDAGADPGKQVDLIVLTSLENKQLTFLKDLKDKWDCKIAATRSVAQFLEGKPVLHKGRTEVPSTKKVVGKFIPYVKVDKVLKNNEVISTGMYKLKVIEFAGSGNIALWDENFGLMFSGTYLGNRVSTGPVHHGGKRKKLELGLHKLDELPVQILCPAYGEVKL